MKASYHFTKRFIQRVLKKSDFTKKEFYMMYVYLNKILNNLEVRHSRGYVVMPGFSDFIIAYNEGIATTILKKEWIKHELMFRSGKISKREYLKLIKEERW